MATWGDIAEAQQDESSRRNGKMHTYSGSISCQKCIKMWGKADEIRTTVDTMHDVKQPRRD